MRRRSTSIWWVILLIIGLFLLFVWIFSDKSKSVEEDSDELKARKLREDFLLKEIEELDKKKELYEKHHFKYDFAKNYLNKRVELRYKQFFRGLLAVVIVITILILVLVPTLNLIEVLGWYSLIIFCFEIMLALIVVKVSKAKEQIKEYIRSIIEEKVCRNRNNAYFEAKIHFYELELENIKLNIQGKKEEFGSLLN